MSLLYKIGNNPIIAAVRKPTKVEQALETNVKNLFFMGGNVKEIIDAVRKTKDAKKGAFVHLDLIRGLSSTDKESVDFIADYVGADGIELMPGILTKSIRSFSEELDHIPIIASGLIQTREEAKQSLQAGATSLSV